MAGLPPEDVVALLEERCHKLSFEIARLRSNVDVATREGVPRVFLVEVEYERGLLETDLEFTRKLAREISSGALEGLDQWSTFHTNAGADEKEDT